jgi:anti-sigma factor RsiW
MNAQHLTTDELADAAEGLLDPERAAFAESHIADCPDCHAQSDALRAVSATLQAEPAPTMPEAVAHRLNDVVAAEQVQRVEASVKGRGLESGPSQQPRATLGGLRQGAGEAQAALGPGRSRCCSGCGRGGLRGVRNQR